MKQRIIVLSVFAALSIALSGMAQDQPTVYTRVASWQIARTHWDAYEKSMNETQRPVLDKLLAEGVIVEYGFDSVNVHGPSGATHSTWFSATSIEGLEHALATVLAADQKLSPVQKKKQDTDFSGDHHQDFLVRSLYHRMRQANMTGGYDVTSMVRVKPGKGQEYLDFWTKYSRPVYEQLFSEGTITAFGLDVDVIHTSEPGARVSWYVVPNASALDKVEAAFRDADLKRSREDSQELDRMYDELVDRASHRDEMSRVLRYASKGSPGAPAQ